MSKIENDDAALPADASDSPRPKIGSFGGKIPPGYWTRGRLAKKLGVSYFSVKRWQDLGYIVPVATLEDGTVLFDDSALTIKRRKDLSLKAKVDAPRVKRGPKPRPMVREPQGGRPSKAPCTREEAACIMRLLSDGKPLDEIAIEARVYPRAVEEIARDWGRLKGALVLPSDYLEAIYKLPVDGVFPFQNAQALVRAVENLCKERTCHQCSRRQAVSCVHCSKARVDNVSAVYEKRIGALEDLVVRLRKSVKAGGAPTLGRAGGTEEG